MHACTFIGHSDCSEDILPPLRTAIEKLIINENVSTFYVGTHGRFDRFAYEILCELETKYSISTFVVLPYLNSRNKNIYYDPYKTIFPSVLDKTPPRFAINKRNLYMIEQSQYMICCIDNTLSNSYTFAKRAINKKLKVINIGKYKLSL